MLYPIETIYSNRIRPELSTVILSHFGQKTQGANPAFLAFIAYFLFHIILYFLPLLVVAAIILALPYLAYMFWKGFKG